MKNRLCKVFLLLCLSLLMMLPARAETFTYTGAQDCKLKALNTLMDCAFAAEYTFDGTPSNCIARWETPIYVYVQGDYTRQDKQTLDRFLCDLNLRVPALPPIYYVSAEADANAVISFAPVSKMKEYNSNYVSGNWGFVTFWWNGRHEMYRMNIVIASDEPNQHQRNSLILEEFTQGLGIQDDIDTYTDSIWYRNANSAQEPTELDWQVLNLLYDPSVSCGMNKDTVYSILYNKITAK